ncbi:glycerate kinase [Actinomyces minihominis]|uniref:glycerate kinase n=1 Tax=Actinomyces minihominis TaxID=2002838 RepID=UPI000C087FFC|nr:glycerate kinase [Actinomyces minihominis]
MRSLKVVCALDSFKGSLGSLDAGEAACRGVLRAVPSAQVVAVPIADGGEGTLDALMWAHGKQLVSVETVDAANRPILAEYGIIERCGARIAVLECAQTVGLHQVAVDSQLPPVASSFGFGAVFLDALNHDVDEILVTLGGSATTDGGTGVFQALGAVLRDANGDVIPRGVNPLWTFHTLDVSDMQSLGDTRVTILGDVKNPMTGPEGAAATFGPQKGATPEQVAHLDSQQARWATVLEETFERVVDRVPGSGAAGGLGGAFVALGGSMHPGFDRVAHEVGLADILKDADLVITGEGSIDSQSAYGKVPSGVAHLAHLVGALAVGLGGRIKRPLHEVDELLDGVFPIHSEPLPLAEAMSPETTAQGIEVTTFEVVRLLSSAHTNRKLRDTPN